MHKLFKPRTIRRILLLLALAFPMVYLMGTAFFALNGSHGNVLLSQDEDVVTSSYFVDFNQLLNPDILDRSGAFFSTNGAYITFNGTNDGDTAVYNFFASRVYLDTTHKYFFGGGVYNLQLVKNDVTYYSGVSSNGLVIDGYSNFRMYKQLASGSSFDNEVISPFFVDLTQMYGTGNEPTAEGFRSRYNADYYDYTLSTKLVEEISETPTYSEYLFNQVFGHDNIVTQLGYYALSEEQKGFAPLSALMRFVDDNILHWGDGNALAVFSYGYVYYAMSTLIVYEIVIIATKLLLLPLKAVDVFDRKGDYDD